DMCAIGILRKRLAYSKSLLLVRCLWVHEHPGGSELVSEHGEAGREECLLHRHEHLRAGGEQRKDAIGFPVAVERQRQIGAANGLEARDVRAEQIGSAKLHPRVKHLAGPTRRALAAWLFTVSHQHGDLSTEMFFVELERLFAIAAVI